VRPACFACVVLAAFAATAHAADDVTVEARRRGDAVEIKAQAVIAAPTQLVWRVLTDYEGLPRFIPGISKSVVRERKANHLVLEQSGKARFLFFSFPIEVKLEVDETPPHWIASHALSGNVRQMSGRYELSDAPGGVVVRYTGFIEPDFVLPPLVGVAALRSTAEEQFTAMVGEIERRAAGGR